MLEPTTRSPTSLYGGKSTVVGHKIAMEIIAGALSIVLAGVAQGTGNYDIYLWDCAIAGLAGFFGGFFFIWGMAEKQKMIAIAASGAMGSLLGPLLANFGAFQLGWVPSNNYFVDAAAGAIVGLVTTPMLRMLRNPGPVIAFLIGLLPFMGKKGP